LVPAVLKFWGRVEPAAGKPTGLGISSGIPSPSVKAWSAIGSGFGRACAGFAARILPIGWMRAAIQTVHVNLRRIGRGNRRDWAFLWLLATSVLTSPMPFAQAQDAGWVTETQSASGWIITLGGYEILNLNSKARGITRSGFIPSSIIVRSARGSGLAFPTTALIFR